MAHEKVLPHDLAAEESVLGSILIDKDSLIEVVEFLRPNHFYDPRNQLIFEAILTLYQKNEPIDIITLTSALKLAGSYTKAGGKSYLSDLVNTIGTGAHIEKYARL